MMKVKQTRGNKKNLALFLTLLLSIIAIQQKCYCSKVEIPGDYSGNVIIVKVTDTRSKRIHGMGTAEHFITTLKTTTDKSSCWPCQRKSKEYKNITYGGMNDYESIFIVSDPSTFPNHPPRDLTWSVIFEEEISTELQEKALVAGYAGISSDRIELVRISKNMITFDSGGNIKIHVEVTSRHDETAPLSRLYT